MNVTIGLSSFAIFRQTCSALNMPTYSNLKDFLEFVGILLDRQVLISLGGFLRFINNGTGTSKILRILFIQVLL